MAERTLLFAMTGFGNSAFEALSTNPAIELAGVFTPPRPEGPFPYYPCEQLSDVVVRAQAPLFEGHLLKAPETESLIRSLRPDLIVVATFNQIIPAAIIALPRLGVVNLHPSLLPKYRGAIPTVCALLNGEERTGVTAHFIEDEGIDRGRIIAQSAIEIDPADNDGMLRRKLSRLSEGVLSEALLRVQSMKRESFACQDEAEATYCLKRAELLSDLDLRRPFHAIANEIRALTPYPGAYVASGGVRYPVDGVTLLDAASACSGQKHGNGVLAISTEQGCLAFSIKKACQP